MKKNVVMGLGFLVAAVFVIVGSMGVLGDISVLKLLLSFLLIVWLVKSLYKLKWSSILFSLAFLAILYDEVLGIEKLTPWPVLGAALLGSIGFSMIFRKTTKHRDKNGDWNWHYEGGQGVQMLDQKEDEHRFVCDVSFGTVVKYIKCQSLRDVMIDNSFGNVTVYFDEAVLDGGRANVTVDNSFGNTKLYIPSDWNVILKVDESFGHVKTFGNDGINSCVVDDCNKLNVSIDTSFGDVEIYYI